MYSRVYVEITDVCNKSCSFCPRHERAPYYMSTDEFELITDSLNGVTKYVYYHVMGEPLLHPRLPEFISSASQKGFRSVVTTNGTLLPKVGDALIASGVYKVNISVHSFEGVSEADFAAYMDGCFDFADKASRVGVLVILRLWNSDYESGGNIRILERLKKKFFDCEWVGVPNGARIRHRLHLEYGERFDWPDREAEDTGDAVFCYALADHFAILCDGSVVPCCLDRNGEMILGNVFSQPIDEILGSERAIAMVEGFKKRRCTEELCRKCGYARRF